MFHTQAVIGIAALLVSSVISQSQYRPGGGAGRPSAGAGGGFGGSGGAGAGGSFGSGGAGNNFGANNGGGGGFNDGSFGGQGSQGGGGGAGGGIGSLEEAIPGIPGIDYPIYSSVPPTSFLCDGQVEGGYYADVEAECQAFHICAGDGEGGLTKFSFLCPNGTLFQQQYFVCDWWFNVDCSIAESLYSRNEEVAAERDAYTQTGGGAAIGVAPSRGAPNRGGNNSGNGPNGDTSFTGSNNGRPSVGGNPNRNTAVSGPRRNNRPGSTGGRRNQQNYGAPTGGVGSAGGPSGLGGGPARSAQSSYGAPGGFDGGVGFGAGQGNSLDGYQRSARDLDVEARIEELAQAYANQEDNLI